MIELTIFSYPMLLTVADRQLTILFVTFFNSQKMAYSGCPGKIFRFIFDQYIFAVSTHQRCVILFMVNGVVTVPGGVRIMIHGIKIHSSD